MHTGTLTELVAEISADMVAAQEAREGFELRDLRRTAENASVTAIDQARKPGAVGDRGRWTKTG